MMNHRLKENSNFLKSQFSIDFNNSIIAFRAYCLETLAIETLALDFKLNDEKNVCFK